MIYTPATMTGSSGPQKVEKEVAPQFQEEPHLFPENQCLCFPLINPTFKNFALITPDEKLICKLSSQFFILCSLNKACAVSVSQRVSFNIGLHHQVSFICEQIFSCLSIQSLPFALRVCSSALCLDSPEKQNQ